MTSRGFFSDRRALLCLLAAALLGGGWAEPAGAQAVAFEGPELQLSQGIVLDHPPGLAPGADGGFFAVWHGALPGGPSGAHFRGFDATGTPLGEARRATSVSSFFGPDGGRPAVAGDGAVGFAILQWTLSGNLSTLEMATFRPSGDLRSGPIGLGDPVSDRQPAAAGMGGPAPHLVVVRGRVDEDAFPASHLAAQRFKPSAAAVGAEVQASSAADRFLAASVAVAPTGSFAVAWIEEDEGGPRRVLARGFGAGDQPLGAPAPVTGLAPGRALALTPGPANGFTVWFLATPPGEEDASLWRRELGPDGRPRGTATVVASGLHPFGPGTVEAAADALGNTVVAWSAMGASIADRTEVFARLYDPDGRPAGPPFRVNADVIGTQESPAVAAVGAERFVVAWLSMEDFGAPAEVRGQLLRVDPAPPGGREREPLALGPERVACDEVRLRGLLERLRVEAPAAAAAGPPGVVLSFTRSGDFAGVAHTGASATAGESQLTFSTNPEETPLLRNPERPPLASVSLSRNPASSDLVAAGAAGRLRLVLDPTLQGFGEPPAQALLAIDNLAGAAGTPSSARPGRGLDPLVTPCHDLFAEDDVQVFRVLQKVLRAEVPGAAGIEIAAYRGEDPGGFRMDTYAVGSRGESLGRLAAELVVEWTPDGQLWTGEVRLLPRCGDGLVRGCTSLAGPAVLELVEPELGTPTGPPPARIRLEASGGLDPVLSHRFAWRDLLSDTTWLETP